MDVAGRFFKEVTEVTKAYPSLPEYRKLRTGEIRLITLESENTLFLRVVPLQDNPQYCALSYCWGESEDLQPIQLNGHLVHLRQGVRSMLNTIYTKYGKIDVWLDMLCINQTNEDEKSDQVARMGVIYREATTVHAWLGEADNATTLIFDVLCEFRDCRNSPEAEEAVANLDQAQRLAILPSQFEQIYENRAGSIPEPNPEEV